MTDDEIVQEVRGQLHVLAADLERLAAKTRHRADTVERSGRASAAGRAALKAVQDVDRLASTLPVLRLRDRAHGDFGPAEGLD